MSEWKPIETAPKTDEPILVVYDNGDIEIIDDSNQTDWQPYDGINQNMMGVSKPTHWMPLPEPPK
jgi:hypothetical protein